MVERGIRRALAGIRTGATPNTARVISTLAGVVVGLIRAGAGMEREDVITLCQEWREMLTGCRYRLERAYNLLPVKDKEWWCEQAEINAYAFDGKLKTWGQFNEQERKALRTFLERLSGFLGRLPKGLRRSEFLQATEGGK